MAQGSLTLFQDHQNVESHLITLFEKLEAVRKEAKLVSLSAPRISMHTEVRTLEFWRSIISECIGTFFYVFIVCGASTGEGGFTVSSASMSTSGLMATALASGFAMATLTQCFGHISGAHVNPAVTVAMAVTRNVSALRAFMFVTAQCGGGIAGAALLYGVTAPTSQGILGVTAATTLYGWEQFGVELLLTFIVVLTYLVCMDSYRQWLGSSALLIGAAYLSCTLVMAPSLNPAKALGPAFVMNKWENHWVHWFGPILGGLMSGLIYEFIFNPRRHTKKSKESIDGDSSSIHSDEDPYDDLDKPAAPKFHGSTYNTLRATEIYRPTGNQGAPSTLASTNGPGNTYCQSLTSASLYSAPACKLDRVESLYGGTKSLYAKSPPLTRANLNRSQSVYSKVISGAAANHREGFPRSGPLVPSQSLYPMSFNQNTSTTNQNVQNQQNQRSESIYGVRGIANSVNRSETGGVYDMNHGNAGDKSTNGAAKFNVRANRPESMYGMVSPRRQDSADVSYGSYHSASSSGTSPRVGVVGSGAAGNTNYPTIVKNNSGAQTINANRNDMRHSPQPPHHQLLSPVAVSTINTTKSVASYHHNKRYSPNIQY